MSYEEALADISALPPTTSPEQRHVQWLGTANVIGVARAADGRTEIFMVGPAVSTIYPTLAKNLAYDMWHRSEGEAPVQANRLILPEAGHFTQVAAFICTELLRHGADKDLEAAFKQCAALIDHSIEGLTMHEAVLTGLKGELLLLRLVLMGNNGHDAGHIINSWHGWHRSIRDFVIGSTGIEVKTTTGSASRHDIQGLHQIELDTQSQTEKNLLLVSVGIEDAQADNTGGFNVSGMVTDIVKLLREVLPNSEATKAISEFLVHVKDYGGELGPGYDHNTMSEDPTFTTRFVTTWTRSYDMTDPNVRVLNSAAMSQYPHVDPRSVQYTLTLPNQVTGDLNPLTSAPALIRRVLGENHNP